MRASRPPARLRVALLAALLAPAVARADDGGGVRPLTVALSVSAGMQYDGRACALAGRDSNEPDAPGRGVAAPPAPRHRGAAGLARRRGHPLRVLRELRAGPGLCAPHRALPRLWRRRADLPRPGLLPVSDPSAISIALWEHRLTQV